MEKSSSEIISLKMFSLADKGQAKRMTPKGGKAGSHDCVVCGLKKSKTLRLQKTWLKPRENKRIN